MRALAILLLSLLAAPAPAQRVVAALNQTRIAIDADFSGSEVFVYGAVTGAASGEAVGVVVALTGPPAPVKLRRKDRRLGVWSNADSLRIGSAPSYYGVAATAPLEDLLSEADDLRYRISLERATRLVGGDADQPTKAAFLDAATRLRVAQGRYVLGAGEVELIEGALFRARFPLPANIVEGVYRARVFLTVDAQVVDRFEGEVAVRKVGMERVITDLAAHQPLLYGVAATLLAMAAGALASELFRYLRR